MLKTMPKCLFNVEMRFTWLLIPKPQICISLHHYSVMAPLESCLLSSLNCARDAQWYTLRSQNPLPIHHHEEPKDQYPWAIPIQTKDPRHTQMLCHVISTQAQSLMCPLSVDLTAIVINTDDQVPVRDYKLDHFIVQPVLQRLPSKVVDHI